MADNGWVDQTFASYRISALTRKRQKTQQQHNHINNNTNNDANDDANNTAKSNTFNISILQYDKIIASTWFRYDYHAKNTNDIKQKVESSATTATTSINEHTHLVKKQNQIHRSDSIVDSLFCCFMADYYPPKKTSQKSLPFDHASYRDDIKVKRIHANIEDPQQQQQKHQHHLLNQSVIEVCKSRMDYYYDKLQKNNSSVVYKEELKRNYYQMGNYIYLNKQDLKHILMNTDDISKHIHGELCGYVFIRDSDGSVIDDVSVSGGSGVNNYIRIVYYIFVPNLLFCFTFTSPSVSASDFMRIEEISPRVICVDFMQKQLMPKFYSDFIYNKKYNNMFDEKTDMRDLTTGLVTVHNWLAKTFETVSSTNRYQQRDMSSYLRRNIIDGLFEG